MVRTLAFLLAILAASMPVICGADGPSHQLVTLPSGNQIRILGIGRMSFANDAPALMLKYETDIAIEDRAKLEHEADEIWISFRPDVEKAGLSSAIISANEKPSGLIVTKSRAYNVLFKKSTDGQWSKLSSKQP